MKSCSEFVAFSTAIVCASAHNILLLFFSLLPHRVQWQPLTPLWIAISHQFWSQLAVLLLLRGEVLKKLPQQPCEMTSSRHLVPWHKMIAQIMATGSTYLTDTCKHTLSQLVPIMLLLLLLLLLSSTLALNCWWQVTDLTGAAKGVTSGNKENDHVRDWVNQKNYKCHLCQKYTE